MEDSFLKRNNVATQWDRFNFDPSFAWIAMVCREIRLYYSNANQSKCAFV